MKRVLVGLIIVIMIFIIYIIAGALIPFASMKTVSEEYKQAFDQQDFYGTGESVDRAAIVETNKEALEERLSMIKQAKERIIISTYDIRIGESSLDICAALYQAAESGIDVKILVDGLSGMYNMGNKPVFYSLGTHPNVEIKYYNKVYILKPWTFNGRMHDKYVVIDDRLLLMGGRNIFDYFLGEYADKSAGYDRDVLIYNTASSTNRTNDSVIAQTAAYFDVMWSDNVCKTVFSKTPLFKKKQIAASAEELKQRYAEIETERAFLFDEIDYLEKTVSIDKATFIYNPTHIFTKEPHVWYQLKQLMLSAEERVVIHTPYAVFSDEMYEGITEISKTVPQTQMLINAIAVGDNIVASSDYIKQKGKILDTGIEVYEFFGEHSSHGKSLIVDQDISVIGSFNFDMRSAYIDTENMLVINGEEFTALLEEKFNVFRDNSLKLDQNGEYIANDAVEEIEIPRIKKIIFAITSRLVPLIRHLA